ncbi:MAG: HEPN domain-containing protein [Bacteroidales bacterium]|nr:HEPN domain-containing protein [Bacteroidales bacterium]
MKLSSEEREIIIKMQLEKSDRFMSEALAVSGLGMWDLVANRLYYSVFHAVAGLFIKDGLEVKSHKGSVLMFGQKYVQTGFFDARWGRLYAKLQDLREKSDYNLVYVSTKDEMQPLLEETQVLISTIKEYIICQHQKN